MNNLKLYCPKCGKELESFCDIYYQCPSKSCYYRLNEKNTIDISFKSIGLAKALSNLCPYPFIIDNIACSSMEAFIQSLKIKEPDIQKDICIKTGPFCYSIRTMFDDWRITQTVYWKGKEINRHSTEYMNLLRKAYQALYEQSPIYRYAIEKSKKYNIIHSIGCTDNTQTLLTPDEYMKLLDELRYCN